ncbi:hypothetical protein [Compostibacter hankyongensis]|uniref:GldB family lipoprotein n=1 Tax=Compostibacter hankyongensis TaxID=1007089 RepID=A0ABP8FEU3_9BACT
MKIKRHSAFRWLLLAVISGAAACHSPSAPDVSHIPMEVKIRRFDRDFLAIDTNRVAEGLAGLQQRYPLFLPIYLENILNYGPYPDTSGRLTQNVRGLLTAADIRALQDTVNAHFSDLHALQHQLESGFRYIRYYFPRFRAPEVITFISGLNNYGAITADSLLGIGLDMFLGKDFRPYTQLADPYPAYMLTQFEPVFIAADCFKVIGQQMFPPAGDRATLLDRMISAGKLLYFLEKVMPGDPATVRTGYSAQQLDWCRKNEQQLWQFFVQHDLLYRRDFQTSSRYMDPGPGPQDMPTGAPGGVGAWVGWQIVRRYMALHPDMALSQLMQMNDAAKLLGGAKYRPR